LRGFADYALEDALDIAALGVELLDIGPLSG